MHVGMTEVIAAVLQYFSHTHVLGYTEVWGTEIGPAAAGPAGPSPTALNKASCLIPKGLNIVG